MKRLTKWVSSIVLALAVLVAIFGLLLPSIFSSRLVVVYSGSMEPALPVGSLLVISLVEPTSITVGDIIAYHPPANPNVLITHRVIEIKNGGTLTFCTKGDANEIPDT